MAFLACLDVMQDRRPVAPPPPSHSSPICVVVVVVVVGAAVVTVSANAHSISHTYAHPARVVCRLFAKLARRQQATGRSCATPVAWRVCSVLYPFM